MLCSMCVLRDEGKMENRGGHREHEEWGNKCAGEREREISHTKELIEALATEMFERSETIRKC